MMGKFVSKHLLDASPELRLNLLLAHPRLSFDQIEIARRLVEEITDPDLLVAMAARKLSLPTISRYFSETGFNERFPESASRSKSLVLFFVTQRLKQLAAIRKFHKLCVEGAGVDALYFKGPTLDPFYAPSSFRIFRDIDLLVEEAHADRLVDRAGACGYRVVLDPEHGLMASSANDVRAARKYLKEMTLLSPDGVSFEVHHRVDRHLSFFDTASLMANSQEVEVAGLRLRTFETHSHFVYLCYHAARHMWSHMHWVADLQAIASHPDFNREACLIEANAHGLRRCVEASLELLEFCSDPENWDRIDGDTRAGILLEACLENLPSGRATELRIRKRGVGPGPDWRVPEGREREFWIRELLFQVSPKITQYTELPLPAGLQWLYYFTRPVYALRHALRGRNGNDQQT